MYDLKKTKEELERKLSVGVDYIINQLSQVEKLSYDDPMRHEIATTIATKLRVFMYDTGNSVSLLKQLDIKQKILFSYDNSGDIASNLVFSSSLVGIQIDENQNMYCVPMRTDYRHRLFCTFSVWWNEIIIDTKGQDYALITRGYVVTTLADKEGGAHEDPKHKKEYIKVNKDNGFILIDNKGNHHKLKNNYYVESLFVIAQEFIDAIRIYNKYIRMKKKTSLDIRYNAIQLSYEITHGNATAIKNRYCLNTDNALLRCLQCAFDYYRKAKYYLIYLKIYRYENYVENSNTQFLVLDNEIVKPKRLVYMRMDHPCDMKHTVLLEQEKGFGWVVNENDIYKELEAHSLEYFKELFGHQNKYLFDNYLSKQCL